MIWFETAKFGLANGQISISIIINNTFANTKQIVLVSAHWNIIVILVNNNLFVVSKYNCKMKRIQDLLLQNKHFAYLSRY